MKVKVGWVKICTYLQFFSPLSYSEVIDGYVINMFIYTQLQYMNKRNRFQKTSYLSISLLLETKSSWFSTNYKIYRVLVLSVLLGKHKHCHWLKSKNKYELDYRILWWLICAMSYKRVFGVKTRKVATRKPAKWWFWRVFAWRPFASPGKDTTNSSRKHNAWNDAYFRVAGRKVAMRKHKQVNIWQVFAWRPFTPPAKTSKNWIIEYSESTYNILDFLVNNATICELPAPYSG